jgi:hypothetical protein
MTFGNETMTTMSTMFSTTIAEHGIRTIGSGIALIILTMLILSKKNISLSFKQGSREEGEPKKKKDRKVVICPFSQDTNFIVESAEHLAPEPIDTFDDWEADPSKPLAARWLAAGLSGQDMPGILRSGLRRLRSSRHFLVEEASRLGPELLLKQKALDNPERHKLVYAAEPESLQAQQELLELFVAYLPIRYPEFYTYDNDLKTITVHTPVFTKMFRLDDWMETSPLELCERIVQEDLILMRPSPTDQTGVASTEQSYYMAAAAVVFSFNELPEKLGKPAEFIHAPVPGFEKHIRKTLNRTFSNLKPEMPMWRNNWGIAPEGSTLDEPLYGSSTAHEDRSFANVSVEEVKQKVLKVEYQTIRRLPRTGYLLFTVKTMGDVIQSLENCPSTAAGCLAASIRGMSPAMRKYKGIEDDATCEAVISYLDSIVGAQEQSVE